MLVQSYFTSTAVDKLQAFSFDDIGPDKFFYL